ncbi:MAG: hypothetical protein H0U89_05345 [Acidimicrobiia bacterium]|nr:hypothetical protein [Acidimicrobiia bacterium]
MARAAGPTAGAGVRTGRARVDRRTKELIKRLQPGEVAVIDHRDLDRVAADGLVEGGAVAVVNAAVSISGRYPNGGPIRVVRAGIPLLDAVGSDLLQRVSEGDTVEVDGEVVRVRGEVVGEGRVLTEAAITDAMEDARSRIGVELERFAANTLQYVKEEARLTFEPLELPPLKTRFQGRHVLVVVRGHDYREDLRHLRAYVSEHRPVLIGVDGGADALLETGLRPDIILGDFDSVSERAVETGAELVHHVHPDGRAPGRDALLELGVRYQEFVVEGTSEDAAMLLAYEAGARLIVAVGTHATMVEFLDKGRAGMSSTFLTRLRLGPALVDAKGVSQLYEGRVRSGDMALLIGAAVAAMLVVILASDPLQTFVEALWLYVRDLWRSLTS